MEFNCKCEHPLIIYNQSLQQYIAVPCGKCNTCKRRAINKKRQQIDNAMAMYKYMIFITLTYDNENLPKIPISYFKDKAGNDWLKIRGESFMIDKHIERNLEQLTYRYSKNSSKGFRKCTKKVEELPVIDVRDVQLYIKRIRRKLTKGSTKYMVLAEYGGVTLRPHYHIIIWTNDSDTVKQLKHDYNSKWKKGRTEWKGANKSDKAYRKNISTYVANYVCSTNSMSKIYASKRRRPKIWGSCGLYVLAHEPHLEEIYTNPFNYFDNGTDIKTQLARRYNKGVSYSILPRCRCFDELSDDCRTLLYKAHARTTTEEIYADETEPSKNSWHKIRANDKSIAGETKTLIRNILYSSDKMRKLVEQQRVNESIYPGDPITIENRRSIKAAIANILHASKVMYDTAKKTSIDVNKIIKTTIEFNKENDKRLLKNKLESLEKKENARLSDITYYTCNPIGKERIYDKETNKIKYIKKDISKDELLEWVKDLTKQIKRQYKVQIDKTRHNMVERAKHREYNDAVLASLNIK